MGIPVVKTAVPVKVQYCLYARKSTEQEDKQVPSIESQIREMEKLAINEGLEIVERKQESHSAKEAGARPVFNEIIEEIKRKKFDGTLTWAPDRISRNAGDLGRIVDLMDQGLLKEIRTYGGQKFTKYLLKHGTVTEQREVLSCIKSKILLKDKKLFAE